MTGTILSEYLSEQEAAKEIGVCTRTLKRWRALREGPAITRIGRKILYRRSTVIAWLVTCEEKIGKSGGRSRY